MDTRILLQFLVVMWVGLTSAQHPIFFPGDVGNKTATQPSEAASRFPPIPKNLRTTVRPSCSLRAGVDENSPCVDDEEYDEGVRSYIQDILTRTGLNSLVETQLFKDLLKHDRVDFPTRNVASRNGGVSETPVCYSKEDYIYPKRAKSVNNEWVFIPNHGDIRQTVRVEKCINEGRPCDFGVPLPVQTICQQKYVETRLLTVGSNRIQPELVIMPSCCVCYRRSYYDISFRTARATGSP